MDQGREHRRWKTEKTKRAFEVALPPAGIAFMFSDKRRIELTRAELQHAIVRLVEAHDKGLDLQPGLVDNQGIAEPLVTLLRKALAVEAP